MNHHMTINGARGEGGGQILRSTLGLAAATMTPVTVTNIRARRKKPGLLRQHLTCAQAIAEVTAGELKGAHLGSDRLTFAPGEVRPGEYHFAVGSAGSAGLVLQTVLPVLLTASGPSRLVLEGGTHNPWAPPFDFLQRAFLPLLSRMGAHVEAHLERHGFYPAGGGRFVVDITPAERLTAFELMEKGEVTRTRATALVVNLPEKIAQREAKVLQKKLELHPRDLKVEALDVGPGPGNVVLIESMAESVTEVFVGFGRKDASSEKVAHEAIKQHQRWMKSAGAVSTFLADQLLVPMALAGGGRFTTLKPSRHTITNAEVVEQLTGVATRIEEVGRDCYEVTVGA